MKRPSPRVDRFELEQYIMNCWDILEDLRLLSDYALEEDTELFLVRKLDAVIDLYDMRFDRLWGTFEELVKHGEL